MSDVSVDRLTKDLVQAARTLSDKEARFLVDNYYIMQESRKRSDNQVRAMSEEPHATLAWFGKQSTTLENQTKRALDAYSDEHPAGRWMKSLYGIGPVIAAGLLAHIDINMAPTVGHIWRFAGLDPTSKWEKGTKRPWNAELKTLCWKVGQSFMKFSGSDECYYATFYKERKAQEVAKNERGDNAELCKNILASKNFSKSTDAYKAYSVGKLPPAHIDARARRYAVKMFLSHMHLVMYFIKFNKLPPKPFVIEHMGHVHFIKPPNAEQVPGLIEALNDTGGFTKYHE
jgi:hypothetical protein